jgi:hypothetical protein
MERGKITQAVACGGAEVLRELVSAELDRRVAAIDDIVVAAYQVRADKHELAAIDKLKVAVLALVRSPLADLERTLRADQVEVADKPASVAA